MSLAKKNDKIVFINVPGDKNALSQRDRELQAAEARAHAARVSRRPPQKAGIVKHEPSGRPGTKFAALFDSPGALAIRQSHASSKRRAKVLKEEDEDEDTPLNRKQLYAVSASSLGQGQVDPFDSAPVKGLDNFIYSILDFGMFLYTRSPCSILIIPLQHTTMRSRRLSRLLLPPLYLLTVRIDADSVENSDFSSKLRLWPLPNSN
jgi:hypothetical protein